MLVGEFDNVRRAIVELSVVTGGCVLFGPGSGIDPDQLGAPPVVTHNDDGCRVPLVLLVEEKANVSEILVAECKVVDIRRVPSSNSLFSAVVEAVGVWNGHVEEKKINGRICKVGVPGGKEFAIVGRVLTDVSRLLGGGAKPMSEKVFRIEE